MHDALLSQFLANFPIDVLIAALQGEHSTGAHLAGAIRHLVKPDSRAKLKHDLRRLPEGLKQTLLNQAEHSGAGILHHARKLLGPGKSGRH